MDQSTIEIIAATVTSRLSANLLSAILVQLALSVICAAFGAYAGGYLRRRGENLATKEDFASLLAQLEANTRLVETIKAEVGQEDWAKRQWCQLRIAKLEELTSLTHALDKELHEKRNHAADGKTYYGPEHVDRIGTLGTLYFPEMVAELEELSKCAREFTIMYIERALEIMQGDNAAKIQALDAMRSDFNRYYTPYNTAVTNLNRRCRAVLVSIAGIAGGAHLVDQRVLPIENPLSPRQDAIEVESPHLAKR